MYRYTEQGYRETPKYKYLGNIYRLKMLSSSTGDIKH